MSLSRILISVAVAAVLAAPSGGIAATPKAAAIPAHVVPNASGLLPDMSLGNPNAKVTVIEYASASCPHCAHWNKDVWPEFRDKYVATGKVRYIFREILTSPPEYALSAFLIGRCAVARSGAPSSSAAYFAVLDTFFRRQEDYYKTRDLGPIGKEVEARTGMDHMAQLDCVTDQTQIDAFYKTMRTNAEKDKIRTTPTFVVNGKAIEGHELKDLDAAITAALR